ncbi:hypothetical protein BH09GEM1_BH09GEM1_33060 [soil metagenome]
MVGVATLSVYVALDVLLRGMAAGRPIPLYPAAGVAMALLILAGAPGVPALMLARFILLWAVPRGPISLAAAVVVAVGQGGAYGAAAALIRRKVGTSSHEWTQREAAWLIGGLVLAPLGAGAVAIALGVLIGSMPVDRWPASLLEFTLGDLIGELIVVPAVLLVLWPKYQMHRGRRAGAPHGHTEDEIPPDRERVSAVERLAQLTAFVASLVLVAFLHSAYGKFSSPEETVCLLLALWIAQREGLRGAALSIAAYGAAAIFAIKLMVIAPGDIVEIQATLLGLSVGALVIGAQRSTSLASEARYWHLLATAREGVWRLDVQGRTLHVNARMATMLGLSPGDVIGRDARDFIAPESLDAWLKEREGRGAGETSVYETLAVHPDGTRVPVLVTGSAVRSSESGEIVGSVALVTDLTDLRKAQSSDRLARQLVESSFRTSRDAMILFRVADEYILDVNDAWCEVTGNTREEAVGHYQKDLRIWGDPADSARLAAALAEHGSVRDFEIAFNRHRPGHPEFTEVGYALLSAAPIQHEGDAYLIVTGRDITGDKRAAAAKRQLGRLEELGRLAGGVAHDFNNLLTVVLAYGETVADDLTHGNPIEPGDIEEILRAGRRGRDLTQRLLAFARHQPSEPRLVNVNEILSAADGMLRTIVGSSVQMVVERGTDLPNILADPSQVDQVLLNLAANARDAMPGGGRFTLRTSRLRAAPGEVGSLFGADALPGDYVLLTATDTGVGMSHAVLDRIFEPFFTTKPAAEGTGLGLSVVFGIMRQARGTVRVTSEPGKGSSFSVAWPATDVAPTQIEEPVARTVTRSTGVRILLVEDDPTVRRVVHRILSDAGYDISTATHGQDAMDHLHDVERSGFALPELVLSDVLMPGINGHELARLLYAEWPALPVILMSGHTGLERLDDLPSSVVLPIIAKPFEVATLLRAIDTALHG